MSVGMPGWQKAAIAIDVVLGIGVAALAVLTLKKYQQRISQTK